ncbi:Ig-like domain-containing protein, partial [Candidatus Uhrbacteria bacterium]|nr:Ig-like domain-containing protein [Candidatus Uhrbacteria bacterium]
MFARTSALPPMSRGVERAITWVTVIATISWSIGLSFLIRVPAAQAAVPTFSGGGPPGGQSFVPPDAVIDIVGSEALTAGSVTTAGNVTLLECTGTTDATTCPATTGSNLCTSVTLTADGVNADRKITCAHDALGTEKTYRLRVSTSVLSSSTTEGPAANVDRIFRTGGFSGGTNTTSPRVVRSFPSPGAMGIPPAAKFSLEFPLGPEGDMKTGASTTGSVENHAHFTLRAIDAATHAPSGTDLCGASGCTLTWNSSTRILLVDPTDLTSGTEYELNVTDLQNNSSVAVMPFFARFTAGAADSTVPTLRAASPTVPINDATGVSRYSGEFTLFFSKAIDQTTATLGTNVGLYRDADDDDVRDSDEPLLGSSALTLTYDPAAFAVRLGSKGALSASAKYCFQIVGGATGVKDLSGNQFASAGSSNICFTTANDTDDTGAKLLFADADNFKLVAKFNEPLNATDATAAGSYTLECPVGVTISLTGKTITYRPDTKEVEIQGLGFQPDQSCRLTVATGLKDLAGNNFTINGTDNVANFKVLNVATTGGFLGTSGTQDFASGTNFATFWEHPSRCAPRSVGAGKATTVECEFSVPSALTTGAKFLLTFPNSFTITSAAAVAASSSFMNADLNGPGPGTTTITGVAADAGSSTVTVTIGHAGTAMTANDHIRFELSGITNTSIPTTDARISVVVKDSGGVKVGQTIQPSPFSIQAGGSLTIKGKVCKGSSSGSTCSGADTGFNSAKVFCDQMGGFVVGTTNASFSGHNEATTDASGVFEITGVSPGQYNCVVPPQPTLMADTGGAPPFQQVSISATANKSCAAGDRSDCVDFKYKDMSTAVDAKTLTVSVTGPASKDLDVFCSAGMSSFEFSAPVMKLVSLNGAGTGSTTLKLQQDKTYDCGIGPHMAFEQFSSGGPPPVPTFDFMPPKPQQVVMNADKTITFSLTSAGNSITGYVCDGTTTPASTGCGTGNGTGIANVFVHAAPTGCFDATSGEAKECFGSFAQTKTDGAFTLKVSPGSYEVGADGPGLPPSTRAEVTVKTDGSLLSKGGAITGNSVILKMVKSSTTISGQVLDESGNAIKYAHVSAEKRTITTGTDACDFSNSRPSGGFADSPTDSSGNYTLYAAAGTWCVRAFAPSYGEVDTKTITVVGTTSQTGQDLQATAAEYGTVSGTITKGDSAAGSAFVNCFKSGTGGNGTQSNADGTYSMKVKAGTGYTCYGFLTG